MKNGKEIFSELPKIVIGELITAALVILCFWGFQKLDWTVAWGLVLGVCTNILCFALLCISVEKMIQDNDPKKAKGTQTVSYIVRMGLLIVALLIALKNDLFNPIATAVPLLMTRPILTVTSLFAKKEGKS